MFYSQTFLARKGPLGTVWCAAHLQNRLKKSHYASTDIPSTVERIMFPEVPIALRMSGHLLLGVVRIYSKKVDYLIDDCRSALNELIKVCKSVQVNLPEEARQATVEAITLPETFDLDALELDDDFHHDRSPDNHLRSQEDITLTDQIPTWRDTYVAITFEEDVQFQYTLQIPDSEVQPMEEDIPHQLLVECDVIPKPQNGSQTEMHGATVSSTWTEAAVPDDEMGINGSRLREQDPCRISTGVSVQVLDVSDKAGVANPSGDVPPLEVPRDAAHDESFGRFGSHFRNEKDHPTEPQAPLVQGWSGKEFPTPNLKASARVCVSSQQRSDSTAAAFEEPDKWISGSGTPNFNIRESPLVQQPRGRQKRRGNFFDERIVLPNSVIQKALEDAGDIVQKRRKLSGTRLGVWKFNKSLRKEKIFDEPTITGLCLEICEMFQEGYISSKPHLLVLEEAQPEVKEVQSPPSGPDQSTPPMPEKIRDDDGANNGTSPLFPQHSATAHICSMEGVVITPGSLGSELSPEQGDSTVHEGQKTPDHAPSAVPDGSEHGTPLDLHFLAADDNTPSGSPASQGRTLSVRTRALAQYFKNSTPSSGDTYGDLSLSKILQWKPRKLCARMFFETLVLKSHDLIDVEQKEPFGDIVLKVAALRKAQL